MNEVSRRIGQQAKNAARAVMLALSAAVPCLGGVTVYRDVAPDSHLVLDGDERFLASAVVGEPPYAADRTGRRDASSVIQRALDDTGARNGGTVFLPAGRYRIDKPLVFRHQNLVLRGEWSPPDEGGPGQGALLLAYPGRNAPDGPALIGVENRNRTSCAVIGLSIWYPEQDAAEPVPYPWTLGGCPGFIVRNVTLVNSWRGVAYDHAGAIFIQNLYGTVLDKGIVLPWAAEFSLVHNVRFSSAYWIGAPVDNAPRGEAVRRLKAGLAERAVGIEIGPLDGCAICGLSFPEGKAAVVVAKDRPLLERVDGRRLGDQFGFGGILGGIDGRKEFNGWDEFYWGIAAANLDLVPGIGDPVYRPVAAPGPRVRDGGHVLDARRYGAVGDGVHDDTDAVLKALAELRRRGGGILCFAQGEYRTTKPLAVPPGVELLGASGRRQSRLSNTETTSLCCHVGKGAADPDRDTAFITLEAGSGMRGLNIVHPEQWELTGETFAPHPFPFAVRGAGPKVWVVDVAFASSCNMIDFGSHRCDGFLLRRVGGCAFNKGIVVGGGSSSGALERCSLSFGLYLQTRRNAYLKEVGWTRAFDTYKEYTGKQTVHYLFGHCDDITAFGLVGFRPRHHMQFFTENGKSCRASRFWLPMMDAGVQTSLVMDAGRDIDFYGYWVTGGYNRFNWLSAGPEVRGVRFFGPSWQQTYLPLPLDKAAPGDVAVVGEQPAPGVRGISPNGAAKALDNDPRTCVDVPLGGTGLVVDLGRPTRIRRIAIHGASLLEVERSENIKEFNVLAGPDGKAWTPVKMVAAGWGLRGPVNSTRSPIVDFPVEPVTARYVKLVVKSVWSGAASARVRELKVYAVDSP